MSVWNISKGDKETTAPQETVDKEGSQVEQVNEPVQQENKKIVLDGPLSTIYTQALNVLYAKEDMAGMIVPTDDVEEYDESDLYVYCTPAELVDNDIAGVADKIMEASKHGKNVVAIECSSMIPSKMGLLEKLGKDVGVKIHVTRNSALEAIRQKVRK